jgi:hypothetical protein
MEGKGLWIDGRGSDMGHFDAAGSVRISNLMRIVEEAGGGGSIISYNIRKARRGDFL